MRGFDRLLYLAVLVGFVIALMQAANDENAPIGVVEPFDPPDAGAPLAPPSMLDPSIVVDLPAVTGAASGTAFAIDSGVWLTARHVVDGCADVGVLTSERQGVRAVGVTPSPAADVAVVTAPLERAAFPVTLDPRGLNVGEWGYFIGYPQGRPGELATRLMGREVLVTRSQTARRAEPVLAWAEVQRSRGLRGSLGGLSGGPAFTADGRVAGVIVAESPRRGRVYTAAPRSVDGAVRNAAASLAAAPAPVGGLTPQDYPRIADRLRRNLRVAKIICTGPAS